MNKLKLLYFIIVVELFMLGIIVFAEKNGYESKNNKYYKNNITEDKGNNKSEKKEAEKNKKTENTKSHENKTIGNPEYKIMNRDEIKEPIDKKNFNNKEKMSLEEIENILKDEAISVFKVECSTIKGSLDFEDKKNILSIAIKVDKKMFNTIKELLYHDNQEYGVLKALLLLKENLNERDFMKVRETASKYVDMSKVEQYYFFEKYGASLQ